MANTLITKSLQLKDRPFSVTPQNIMLLKRLNGHPNLIKKAQEIKINEE